MPLMLRILVLLVAAPVAGAQISFQSAAGNTGVQAPPALSGTWGTEAQCAAHQAGVKDDMRLLPYIITAQWMRRGFLYCQLTWLAQPGGGQAVQTSAHAVCGEDDVRDYRVFFSLRDGILKMRWSRDFTTEELRRCR